MACAPGEEEAAAAEGQGGDGATSSGWAWLARGRDASIGNANAIGPFLSEQRDGAPPERGFPAPMAGSAALSAGRRRSRKTDRKSSDAPALRLQPAFAFIQPIPVDFALSPSQLPTTSAESPTDEDRSLHASKPSSPAATSRCSLSSVPVSDAWSCTLFAAGSRGPSAVGLTTPEDALLSFPGAGQHSRDESTSAPVLATHDDTRKLPCEARAIGEDCNSASDPIGDVAKCHAAASVSSAYGLTWDCRTSADTAEFSCIDSEDSAGANQPGDSSSDSREAPTVGPSSLDESCVVSALRPDAKQFVSQPGPLETTAGRDSRFGRSHSAEVGDASRAFQHQVLLHVHPRVGVSGGTETFSADEAVRGNDPGEPSKRAPPAAFSTGAAAAGVQPHDHGTGSTSSDSVSTGSPARNSVSRDSASKVSTSGESVSRDSVLRSFPSRNSVSRDSASKVSTSNGVSTSRESVSRDSVSRDSVSRGSASRGSPARNSVSRDSASRVSPSRLPTSRNSPSRGSLSRGPASRDSPSRGSLSRPASRDSPSRGSLSRGPASRSRSRGSVSRGPASRDSPSRGPASRGSPSTRRKAAPAPDPTTEPTRCPRGSLQDFERRSLSPRESRSARAPSPAEPAGLASRQRRRLRIGTEPESCTGEAPSSAEQRSVPARSASLGKPAFLETQAARRARCPMGRNASRAPHRRTGAGVTAGGHCPDAAAFGRHRSDGVEAPLQPSGLVVNRINTAVEWSGGAGEGTALCKRPRALCVPPPCPRADITAGGHYTDAAACGLDRSESEETLLRPSSGLAVNKNVGTNRPVEWPGGAGEGAALCPRRSASVGKMMTHERRKTGAARAEMQRWENRVRGLLQAVRMRSEAADPATARDAAPSATLDDRQQMVRLLANCSGSSGRRKKTGGGAALRAGCRHAREAMWRRKKLAAEAGRTARAFRTLDAGEAERQGLRACRGRAAAARAEKQKQARGRASLREAARRRAALSYEASLREEVQTGLSLQRRARNAEAKAAQLAEHLRNLSVRTDADGSS